MFVFDLCAKRNGRIATTLCYCLLVSLASGQTALPIDSPGFVGTIHDNASNEKRQGSGLSPLSPKAFPHASLFRPDAVGLNFEHVFNGAKAQFDQSMFTPRQDPCLLEQTGPQRFELRWPSEGSQWGLDARMAFDFSQPGQIDLAFECTPTRDLYPRGYAAMMWASYMNRAVDRRLHFWGRDGGRTGWLAFGEGTGHQIELGAVAHADAPELTHEEGAQALNLSTHPTKRFLTPFYYGLVDGDHDLTTDDDRLLFLVLFDQTEPIRFAMWNFFKNEAGEPDTRSPAWDWHYVIREPQVGKRYGYRARVVVKPFRGAPQVWDEYRRWREEVGGGLPPAGE